MSDDVPLRDAAQALLDAIPRELPGFWATTIKDEADALRAALAAADTENETLRAQVKELSNG